MGRISTVNKFANTLTWLNFQTGVDRLLGGYSFYARWDLPMLEGIQ